MTAVPPRPAAPEHNHVTRDIKPVGKCPACDDYWGTNWGYPTPADSPAAADSGTPASPRRTVTDGTTDSVAIHRSAQQETNSAPDATAGDGLREAIAEALWRDDTGGDVPLSTRKPGTQRTYARIADTLLAGPLRDVLAAAARDAEAVAKVRELHAADDTEPHACTECGEAWPCCTIQALDPS